MEKSKEYDYNSKFANWNKGFDDIFDEIREIREIGNKVLFDYKNDNLLLNLYCSRIIGLFSTHSHYVLDRDKLALQLNKIENVLFSDKYLTSIKNNTNPTEQQIKITKALRLYFQLICESFSKNGLTMKIIKEQKDDPYQSVLRGYN